MIWTLPLHCPSLSASDPEIPIEALPSAVSFQQEINRSYTQGIEWLLNHQSEEGRWRSETYGTMQSGVGNTSLIVSLFTQSPSNDLVQVKEATSKGIESLAADFDPQRGISSPEDLGDSPHYAAAFLLTAISQLRLESHHQLQKDLVHFLKNAQRTTRNGWSTDHPDYGGWGTDLDAEISPRLAMPSNISVTSSILTALEQAEALDEEVRTPALEFLTKCQNWSHEEIGDGGFYFTSRPDDLLNKAGASPSPDGEWHALSYLSATCDGLIAMKACGLDENHPRVIAARECLLHLEMPAIPQLPVNENAHDFQLQGIFYYSAASLARLKSKSSPTEFSPQLENILEEVTYSLIAAQQPDGSWRSPLLWMKEDDPLIATSFALMVLSHYFQKISPPEIPSRE